MADTIHQGDQSAGDVIQSLRRVLRYVAPFRTAFAVKVALVFVTLLASLLLPWPVKILIDHVIQGLSLSDAIGDYPFFVRPFLQPLAHADPVTILSWMVVVQVTLLIAVGAIGVGGHENDNTDANLSAGQDMATQTENEANFGHSFAGGLLGIFEFRWTIRLTQAFNQYYRVRLFDRIQALPITALDDQRVGDAVYRLMYDTPAITGAAYRLILTPILAPLGIIITAAAIYLVFPGHERLMWTALALLPFSLLATLPFATTFRRRGRLSREAGSVATATVEEGLTNVLAVQSLGGHDRQREELDRDSWESFTQHRALVRAILLSFVIAALPVTILFGTAFLYVIDQVVDGRLTVGDFALLFTYFVQAGLHAMNLGTLWVSVQGNAAGLQRVFELMDYAPPAEHADATLPRPRPELRLDDVHFDYAGVPALRGVSFDAHRGQIVAIVGPTGAGKTTLAYMIPRFLTPTRGRVLIDGVDIGTVTHTSLREHIAFVFQETALFDMSVAENLRLAKPEASDDALWQALRLAGADDVVAQLPGGLHARLGRSGSKLSVGQRQRLSIARAFVRDSPILIMDEPTSALDVDTEHALLATLDAARAERLQILITHRLAAARMADLILFLDHGVLVESGSHETLMRANGPYRRFVELQVRGG